jgi:spore coat protein JB
MTDKRKQTLMNKIQAYCFAAHECVLYLDGHPQNRKALAKYAEYSAKAKEATTEYESLYGPLTAMSNGDHHWAWVSGNWPWQNMEDDR